MSEDVFTNPNPSILQALKQEIFASLRAALPGIILEYDAETQRAVIQPGLRGRLKAEGDPVLLPVLRDVPVFMPRFSDPSLTLEIRAGDLCLLVFADINIDGFLEAGSAVVPASGRMHDLSDAFAFVGFRGGGSAT